MIYFFIFFCMRQWESGRRTSYYIYQYKMWLRVPVIDPVDLNDPETWEAFVYINLNDEKMYYRLPNWKIYLVASTLTN